MGGPGRITKIVFGVSRRHAVAPNACHPLTTDQIRSVAHRMGVIGKVCDREGKTYKGRYKLIKGGMIEVSYGMSALVVTQLGGMTHSPEVLARILARELVEGDLSRKR